MIHYKRKLLATGACERIMYIKEDGGVVRVPKIKFNTQDAAIDACKGLNSKPNQTHKVVPYYCPHCGKYHVGRNGNLIKKKK